jgi:CheY-like chemotaxis protein
VSKTLRVLHVDDDPVNLLVMDHMLRALGHNPKGIGEPATVVAALAHEAIDIILTDIHMPDLDGVALLEALQKTHPLIPVVAVTADVMTRIQSDYEALGFAAALGKPVLLKDLTRAMEIADDGPERAFFAVGIAKG